MQKICLLFFFLFYYIICNNIRALEEIESSSTMQIQKIEFKNQLAESVCFDFISQFVASVEKGEVQDVKSVDGHLFYDSEIDYTYTRKRLVNRKNKRSIFFIPQKMHVQIDAFQTVVVSLPAPHCFMDVLNAPKFTREDHSDGFAISFNNDNADSLEEISRITDCSSKIADAMQYVDANPHYGVSFQFLLSHGFLDASNRMLRFLDESIPATLKPQFIELLFPFQQDIALRVYGKNCWGLVFKSYSPPCLIQGDRVHMPFDPSMKNALLLSDEPSLYLEINKIIATEPYNDFSWDFVLARDYTPVSDKFRKIRHNAAISSDAYLFDSASFINKIFSVSYLLSTSQGEISSNPWNIPSSLIDVSLFNYSLRIRIRDLAEEIRIPKTFYASARDRNRFGPDQLILPEYSKRRLFDSMFHICVENISESDYFSEKILDAFLGESIPIYKGCPNISKYFDINGIICFNDEKDLIDICNNLKPEDYSSRIESVKENRKRALKYIKENHLPNFLESLFSVDPRIAVKQDSILVHYPLNLMYYVALFSITNDFEFNQILLRLLYRI